MGIFFQDVKERIEFRNLDIKSAFRKSISGGYRSRTDDPLRARQVLWPAELIPQFTIKRKKEKQDESPRKKKANTPDVCHRPKG